MVSAAEESWVTTDDGVRLWTVRSGSGSRPVVLCHGGPGGWDQMEPVADMLDEVATVIRWDQRGCGRSEGDGPYTCERFLADLDAVRRHWGVDRITVAGHSGGASLALFYALEYSAHVRAVLYLSGTGLRWGDRDSLAYRSNREDRLGSFLGRWRELRGLSTRTPEQQRELTLLTWSTDFGDTATSLDLAEAWLHERFEANLECNAQLGRLLEERAVWARDHVYSISCPVLVVHGDQDPRPSRAATELAQELPDGRLALLRSVGHLPWAQSPNQLRTVLREFLVLEG